MKAPTLLGIAVMLTLACFGLSAAIPGPLGDRFKLIGGCMVLGFGGLAYIAAAGVDYSKKKRQWEAEHLQSAQEPEPIAPEIVSNGSAPEEIQIGKWYTRDDAQAQANDYYNPNAPADTVQIHNVDAPAKPGKAFELEVTT
jgi:hypothetical protein